jgi:hypothetical protein
MADGLRAGIGLLMSLGPLVFLTVGRPLAIVLGGIGMVFLLFGFRVLGQCVFSITATTDGLSSGGLRRRNLDWQELLGLKLAYYAPLKRRDAGWYQLKLIGERDVIRVDSTLDGFDDLMRAALEAAAGAGLVFDPSTRDNLAAWVRRNGDVKTDASGAMPL